MLRWGMASQLSRKMERFCNEFIIDMSVTGAAVRAGYSEKTAAQQGSRLLRKPEVAALVRRLHKEKLDRVDLRAENVIKELATIAFSDVRSLLDSAGQLVPVHLLPDEAAASIASFDVTTAGNGQTRISRIKTWNKVAALEQLCKHLGLLRPEQHEHLHAVVHFTPDQLRGMTDGQLGRIEGAYAVLASVRREVLELPSSRPVSVRSTSSA